MVGLRVMGGRAGFPGVRIMVDAFEVRRFHSDMAGFSTRYPQDSLGHLEFFKWSLGILSV